MPVAINHINGVVILPDSRILTIKRISPKQVHYVDDYKVTFQCPLLGDEDESQCINTETERLFGIAVLSPIYLDLVKIIRVGYTHKNSYSIADKILIYLLQITGTITLKTLTNYELRPLPLKKALDEALHADLVGYQNGADAPPKYTNAAKIVLQEINSYGGVNECIEKSL